MVDPIAESYKKQVLNEARSMKKMKVTSPVNVEIDKGNCAKNCRFLQIGSYCALFEQRAGPARCGKCKSMFPDGQGTKKVTAPVYANVLTLNGKTSGVCVWGECKFFFEKGLQPFCSLFQENIPEVKEKWDKHQVRCASCQKMFPTQVKFNPDDLEI